MNRDQQVVTAMRVIAAEAIQKANTGHPGMAIGSAPAAFTLFKHMRHNPKNPLWPGRDRFVLSSGHASMLQYTLLHFFNYGLPMSELANFRQLGSLTPGHPEHGHTVGVEASTGPLGQGFGMAVGMAMAEAHQAAVFNRPGYNVIDNHTYVLMGDGCMMEGATAEAASLAGTLKLGKLIALYDSNGITIEGATSIAFTEDVETRFSAYHWHVQVVEDGEDMVALAAALQNAKEETERPSLIIYKTVIGHGSPNQGTSKVHGEPLGAENLAGLKKNLGWAETEPFAVPDEIYAYTRSLTEPMQRGEDEWNALYAAYKKEYPALAAQWEADCAGALPELESDPSFWAFEGKAASRASSGETLNRLYQKLPRLFGGSADLAPSNKTNIKGAGDFSAENYAGKNIHFGVREMAMTCAVNGMALYGGLTPFCATFFVFSDYVKPALRLSAIMGLPVLFILTHDSIGVGEDGPTHQPIEQLAALRATPNTLVFRPADAREVAAGYVAALQHKGPTVLALTRQNLPLYERSGSEALKGGYILREPKGTPDVILLGSGSEVNVLFGAADILSVQGYTARIVSMPSMELFNAQSDAYRESVLPASIRARVAVEAGATLGWHRYTGLDGAVLGIDRFGASAPQEQLFKAYGFTPEHVAETALAVIRAQR